jgi:hypothetical protein
MHHTYRMFLILFMLVVEFGRYQIGKRQSS